MSARQGGAAKKERAGVANAAAKASGKQKKVKFQVKAAEGSTVSLAGSFNNWDPHAIILGLSAGGHYSTTVALPPGRHEYKFVVNGEWQIDEKCPQWVPNASGTLNSVVEVV